MEELKWLVWPFCLCVVLVGIHGYLGIHVLARKVIFVDLAMAQIAALGATCAFALGYDPARPEDQAAVFGFSVAFALAGAAVFAFTRMRQEKVPQEAFIGIVYASATAVAILVLAKLPHGGEHLKHMFEGNILFVQWPAVRNTALLYAAVGAFHWIFRRKFFLISFEPERALAEGVSIRGWDFLFYASFGLVITSSVAVAGVLLVFTYLVVPACVAVLFVQGARARLVLAWIVGVLVTVAGLMVSDYGSFPTGPAVVGAFAVVLAVAGMAHAIRVSPHRGRATLRAGAFAAGLFLLGWGTTRLAKSHEEHPREFADAVEALHSGDEARQIQAIRELEEMHHDRGHAVEELIGLLRHPPSDRVIEHLAEALAHLGDPAAVKPLVEAARGRVDGFLKLTLAQAVLTLRGAEGFLLLIELVESTEPIPRREAARILKQQSGIDADPAALRGWWESRGRHLLWRESTKRFE